ncbi:MAG: NGG1p interacting factor NIF3 [Proteobacteria bacterium]|nr:NGG1p interacting factor NIF3 [Pseudomonadota bacterium]
MKFRDIYEKAYRRGIELDPRGTEEVASELERAGKDYADLKESDKKYYDTEKLKNPYSDTRILYGDPDTEVRRVMVGIDMEVGELLLADRLTERGTKIDLVIAHHPEGKPMADLYDVMDMQSGILHKYGVPVNVAEDIMDERIKEVERRLMPVNHTRAVDAARLLDIPFMCVHTPTDNAVTTYLQDLFDAEEPRYVSDVIDILRAIPEYAGASVETLGPKIVCGTKRRRVGKVFVDMTGGTGGSKKAFETLTNAGVSTIVGMHIGEEHRKEASKNHINVVIAGHMASDSIGINLMLDHVLDPDVEVLSASGFRRIKR